MKTEALIHALTRDALPPHKLFNRTGLLVTLLAFALACFVFFDVLPIRYSLWTTGFNPTVMKLLFTLALSGVAMVLLLANLRPSQDKPLRLNLLIGPLAIFAAYVLYDFAQLGTERLSNRFFGYQFYLCFFSVVSIASLPLVGLLWAMKTTAPRKPAMAGMAAGILSASAAASAYALHCSNDSPLFLFWYICAIAFVAAMGALFAKRVLVW